MDMNDFHRSEGTGVREPKAEQRQAASEMRGMFVALVNEGFSEEQALTIIGISITAAFGGGMG